MKNNSVMSATHYIHIGRNRCASTTLQHFFMNSAAALAAHGVDHFVHGRFVTDFPDHPGLANNTEYRAYLKKNPDRSTLISDEWFMALPPAYTRAQIEALEGAPCRVIAYIRDYPSWLRSNYVQSIRAGWPSNGFDEFFERTSGDVSALTSLSNWAHEIGWGSMHVRGLEPRSLYGGDVIQDCVHAMGLPDIVAEGAARMNQSPHWLAVETLRAARLSNPEMSGAEFRKKVGGPLVKVAQFVIERQERAIPPAQYLTPEQFQHLSTAYNTDANVLSELSGSPVLPVQAALSARPFEPSIEAAPRSYFEGLRQRISWPDFGVNHPVAKAAAEAVLAEFDP